MNYIGIDPGLDGAICYLLKSGDILLKDFPTLTVKSGKKNRREFSCYLMADLLSQDKVLSELDIEIKDCHIALEKVHSMPGQGVRSMFSMGQGYGIWLGIIASYRYPLTLVTPQAWKKVMMAGMGKEKDASRQKAMQLFPQCAEDLKLKKHHGRADALLIAEYLRRIS